VVCCLCCGFGLAIHCETVLITFGIVGCAYVMSLAFHLLLACERGLCVVYWFLLVVVCGLVFGLGFHLFGLVVWVVENYTYTLWAAHGVFVWVVC